MIPLGWILVLFAIQLVIPLIWVAIFNFVGLKRMLERLNDLESVNETVLSKTRSLQTQISKKTPKQESPGEDDKITQEITAHINGAGETQEAFKFNRGGIINADSHRVSEPS